MDLLCTETPDDRRAYPDPALLNDERVLQNLLASEERYSPSAGYFHNVQTDLTPQMRKIVAEWLLEVCEEQCCQEEVFPLAMNYLDRFLSTCVIKKNQLQLLGTACLLVATKLRETRAISAERLVFYTDNSITLEELKRWEMLILSKLKWNLSAVTPPDFLPHLLRRLPVQEPWDTRMILKHAHTFIALATSDYCFSMYTPSMVASASLAAALHGLDWTGKSGCSLNQLLDRLQMITAIERDYLQSCLHQIEEMVTSTISNHPEMSVGSVASGNGIHSPAVTPATRTSTAELQAIATEKLAEHGKAGTPTDVRDIHF